jgi:ketosteroid isomerase-like protein
MNAVLLRRRFLLFAGTAFCGWRLAWPQLSKPGAKNMSASIESRCKSYLEAWSRKDLEGVTAHIHPDVHFKAPMQEFEGRDAYVTATTRVFPLLERLDVRGQFISGDRAVLIYDFVCRPPIDVSRTAEMVRFQDGLIRETELFFDARPFEAMQKALADKAASK